MSQVTIVVRPNGPFVVQGPVKVVDADGNVFVESEDKPIALCRCGAAKNRPFCDGAHKECGFQADDRVSPRENA